MKNVNFEGTNGLTEILAKQLKMQLEMDRVDIRKNFVANTKYKLVRSTGVAVAATAISGITNFYFYNNADTYPLAILWGTYLLASIGGVYALFYGVNKVNKALKEQKKELIAAECELRYAKDEYYSDLLDFIDKTR